MAEDDRWIAELRAGESAAVERLRDTLLRNLRRAFAARAVADGCLLEDMAQEGVLWTLDRLDRFEGRSRLATWATTIAIRLVYAELRRRRWKDVSLDQAPADPAAGETPEDELGRADLIAALHEAIGDALTDRQRAALTAELRGVPMAQIAEEFGVARNAIYKLTHDARKRLRTHLEQAGYTADDLLPSSST